MASVNGQTEALQTLLFYKADFEKLSGGFCFRPFFRISRYVPVCMIFMGKTCIKSVPPALCSQDVGL